MLELLNLANEVLLRIIADVHPFDLENLTLACKQIYLVGKESLDKHRQRRRLYATITFGYKTGVEEGYLIYLLVDILEDNSLAGYPKRLLIGNCGEVDKGVLPEHDIPVENMDAIISALNECPYLDSERRKDVEIGMLDGESNACLALLVTFLLNLRSIETSGFSENTHCFRVMVSNIGHVSLEHCHRIRFGYGNQAKTQTVDALCKLQHVSVDSYNLDMQEMNDDFGLLTCFVSLPSMRSLCGNMVEPKGIENPYFDEYGSEITKIHLKHSAVHKSLPKKGSWREFEA